jgi:RNA 2',3'-cyclic 3'-phosphodiesterase
LPGLDSTQLAAQFQGRRRGRRSLSHQTGRLAGQSLYGKRRRLAPRYAESMRVFVALDVDEAIRQRITTFMEGVRGFAPDARWVRPESLHVTLKFIGEKPSEQVEEIKRALAAIRAQPFEMAFRGFGFFPTAKAARVFWIGISAGDLLGQLASAVDAASASLGIPKEDHAFSPHLTMARGGGRSGAPAWRKGDGANRNFHVLQEKLAALPAPEFGNMTAQEFFLYQSELMRGGSRYRKLERFELL